MRLRQRGAQPVGIGGHEDKVDVIVHQAPGEAFHPRFRAALAQEINVEQAVLVGEEDRLPAIAALGDVMRDAGDDDAGEAGHSGRLAGN